MFAGLKLQSLYQAMSILAFDIGIKNLAFCILEPAKKNVVALRNCSLIPSVEKIPCSLCPAAASLYSLDISGNSQQQLYCRRHAPRGRKVLSLKEQTLKPLREAVRATGQKPANKISALLMQLAQTHLFTYTQPRQTSANTLSLVNLHNAIRAFISEHWTLFRACTTVLLENQPVLKNAHMKSVQVILFTALRERFLQEFPAATAATTASPPPFHLVHAKKKSEDAVAPAGDEGYKQRKSASETRTRSAFETGGYGPLTLFQQWSETTRRSDMADAFCMCLDFSAESTPSA